MEFQGNPFMPAMNHAALGIRRRVRCLLAGKKGGNRVGHRRHHSRKLLKTKIIPPQYVGFSHKNSTSYL